MQRVLQRVLQCVLQCVLRRVLQCLLQCLLQLVLQCDPIIDDSLPPQDAEEYVTLQQTPQHPMQHT